MKKFYLTVYKVDNHVMKPLDRETFTDYNTALKAVEQWGNKFMLEVINDKGDILYYDERGQCEE